MNGIERVKSAIGIAGNISILSALLLFIGQVRAADIEITSAVTSQQDIPENQSLRVQGSGSVTTNTEDTEAILGFHQYNVIDQGGNTITLESGAVVKTTRPQDATEDYSHAVRVYGFSTDNNQIGLAGGGPLTDGASNIVDMQAGSYISTTGYGAYGIKANSNNSITAAGSISKTGKSGGGITLNQNNYVEVSGSITTKGSGSVGINSRSNNEIILSGSITTEGNSGDGIAISEEKNTINILGSITTSGESARAVYIRTSNNDDGNNTLTLSGSITTSGATSGGIEVTGKKQTVDVTGSITTSGTTSYGINMSTHSTINLDGTIKTSGNEASGIKANNYNSLSLDGVITTSGTDAHGLLITGFNNSIVSTNSIKATGVNSHAIYLESSKNVAHISGSLSATGSNSYAICSGSGNAGGDTNTIHILSGTSLTGGIHNGDSSDNQTSYLTFGYAKVDNKADLTTPAADPAFSFTFDESITSDSTGNWDSFFAGGSITLNGSTNTFRNIFIGGAAFDGTTVPDGHTSSGTNKTVDLDAIGGSTAILNITNAISTNGTVAVGTGSTYNLSGTHTHTGTDITVSGSGKIDLANGGNFINNATGGTQSISNFNVSSGIGTLSGNDALDTVSDVNIDGTLNFEATTDTTFALTNLNGRLNNNSASSLTLTDLTVGSGETGILSGSGGGTLIVSNSPTINGTLKVNRSVTFSNGINSMGLNGILSGSGSITGDIITGGNGGSIQPDGTLSVSGDVTVNTGDILELALSINDANKLTATGTIDMEDSILNIVANSPKVGSSHIILQADTALVNLTANDINIINKPVLLNIDSTIGATTLQVDVTQVANGCKKAANGGANVGISTLLDNQFSDHPSSMDDIFDNLNTLQSNNDVNNAMTQLQTNSASGGIAQSSLFGINMAGRALNTQLTSFRMGNATVAMSSTYSTSGFTSASTEQIADADDLAVAYSSFENEVAEQGNYNKWTGFARLFGGFGQQGSGTDSTGYDYGSFGVITGLDYAISRELRLGGILGYTYNRSNLYNSLGNGIDKTVRLGTYASFNWDKLFVDISPTIGIHMIETNRNIAFMTTSAKGERTGFDFNLSSTAGYEFTLPKDFLLTPGYSLGFTTLYDPQYTETSATGGANLRVNERTTYSLLQTLNIKLGKLFRINDNLSILPEIWGGWEHEYLNTGGEVTSAFSNAPSQSWTSDISTIANDRAVFGCGLTGLINNNISVFGHFNQKIWDKGFNTEFLVGVKVLF